MPLDHPALSRRVAPLEEHHDLEFPAHHPILQLHQFALEAKQLLEVDVTVERLRLRMLGQSVQEFGQTIVIDFQFELFVDGIEHLAVDAMEPGRRVVGHGCTRRLGWTRYVRQSGLR